MPTLVLVTLCLIPTSLTIAFFLSHLKLAAVPILGCICLAYPAAQLLISGYMTSVSKGLFAEELKRILG